MFLNELPMSAVMNNYELISDEDNTQNLNRPPATIDKEGICHMKWIQRITPLLHGQYISLLISGTALFASLLASKQANCPMMLSFFNYFFLSLHIVRLLYNREIDMCVEKWWSCGIRLQWPFWVYFVAALLDVEANVLIISAYNYTSVTSIMLLDCFTIPCVMLLSVVFLGATYNRYHLGGVVICLLGLGCVVYSDTLSNSDSAASQPLKGDVLCLIGACLYAASNVLQETLVKSHNRIEFLGMLGLNGALISGVQMAAFELKKITSVYWGYESVSFSAGFVVCLFLMYCNTSVFLKANDAALFNLSLLTSDAYAVAIAYLVFGNAVHWLYYLAFALAASGLVLYHSGGAPSSMVKSAVDRIAAVIQDKPTSAEVMSTDILGENS